MAGGDSVIRLRVLGPIELQDSTGRELTSVLGRDPMSGHLVEPAAWRFEGRLATRVGDTTAAIHAYTRFLEIRDQPDPGPLSEERREVQRHRAALMARSPSLTEGKP
jgi:hypothetical protein